MGLMANDLRDVSRRGIAELHVDEAHRSNHVVKVDKALPAWGKNRPTCNKAS